jgi:hypothetical protein
MQFLRCLFFLALSSPALAVSDNPLATGLGLRNCGQFNEQYRKSSEEEDKYFEWAKGFMSGMNSMFGPAHAPLKNLTATNFEIQKSDIRKYCESHSVDLYESAVLNLFASLPNAKPLSRSK